MIGRKGVLTGLFFAHTVVAAAGTTTSTYLGNARRTAYVDAEVYTSGLSGPLTFTAQLANEEPARYDATLHFVETENAAVGQRVFDVKIQGKTVISSLDIAGESGGIDRALTRGLRNVAAKQTLTIDLVPVRGRPPLICAMEVLRH
jgi:hypothetical protein